MARFPAPRPGVLYLTEGGQETELMQEHGHDLPEFALYPLLDNSRAVADLVDMYPRVLDIAAAHGCAALIGGLDYRASQIGHLEAGDPATLGAQIGALTRRLPNIDVLGGCCGTWDHHLRAIAEDLRPLHSAA